MSLATYHAKALLKKFGIKNAPIDPYGIAREMSIEVKEDDCEGYVGMLLVVDGEALISVKSKIQEYSKKRFTVAHEIGHFSIPGHITPQKYIFQCTDNDLSNIGRIRVKEAEANAFAAELLMPEEIFREKIKMDDLSYELIQDLTSDFETSLTAASIRFVELSGHYALIVSDNSSVTWSLRGDNFPYYVRSNGRLDSESIAIEFFRGNTLPKSFEPVAADAWLDDRKVKGDTEVRELSIPLTRYNQVLSFLYAEPDEIDSEDEEDEYLEELNGYPKFRK
jgi:hypothetical protein